MKHQLAKAFLVLMGFILIVGLACSATAPEEAPAAAPAAPVEEPAAAPAEEADAPAPPPTAVPEPTAIPEPTEPPTPEAQRFFTEEFDGDLSNWDYFYFADDESGFDISPDKGRLVFDITGEYNYVYSYYTPEIYEDVRVETEVNNRGFNNNNVSLICRYDEAEGWYEFNIANNGMYWIYVYDERGGQGFVELASGGSNEIRMGKDTNQYSAVCNGRKLTLYINGVETNSIEDNKFVLRDGMVGVSVSSFDVIPINVEVEWFTIMEP